MASILSGSDCWCMCYRGGGRKTVCIQEEERSVISFLHVSVTSASVASSFSAFVAMEEESSLAKDATLNSSSVKMNGDFRSQDSEKDSIGAGDISAPETKKSRALTSTTQSSLPATQMREATLKSEPCHSAEPRVLLVD